MEQIITDEFMQRMLVASKADCLVILRTGPNYDQPGANKTVWEHGRRNFQLRAEGFMLNCVPLPVIHTCDGNMSWCWASEDFVAGLDDQFVLLAVEPLAVMVGYGSAFLQRGIGSDHLARDQILADPEMLERTLGLSAPELIRRHFDETKAVCFFSRVGHVYCSLLDRFDIADVVLTATNHRFETHLKLLRSTLRAAVEPLI